MSWPLVALGDVADVVRQGVDPKAVNSNTRYVGLENISSDGSFSDAVEIESGSLASTKFAFTSDHVLFGKLRPYLRKVVRPDFSGICSTDIIPIAPSKQLNRDYLFHFLRTDKVITRATSMASGANLPRINPRHLVEFEIPLPPLDEQRRIAAILDQVDALRRKRRETIKLTKNLERAALEEMFGAPDTNARGLPFIEFGELISDGPTNGLYKPSTDYGDGSPILRIGDFYDGRLVNLDRLRRLRATSKELLAYALKENDVVINRVNSREYLGKSALVPTLKEPTIFESNMMRIRLDFDQIDPVYCVSFLQTPFVKRQILQKTKDAINQSSINQKDVGSFMIMLPPLDEQRRFARFITAVEGEVSQLIEHLAQLDALFASLQHRAFNGELTSRALERELAEAV